MSYEPKDATPATVTANRKAVARYDMADRQDFEFLYAPDTEAPERCTSGSRSSRR